MSEWQLNVFIEAVAAMRHQQKEYFRTRSAAALEKCKAAEKKVDVMCSALQCGQRSLFEDQ